MKFLCRVTLMVNIKNKLINENIVRNNKIVLNIVQKGLVLLCLLKKNYLFYFFLYFLHLKVNRLKLDFLINAFSINIRAYEILVKILQYLARFVLKYK